MESRQIVDQCNKKQVRNIHMDMIDWFLQWYKNNSVEEGLSFE